MPPLSFAQAIRPLFRDKDINTMQRIAHFNLSKYNDVRERAVDIYARLSEGSMPCDSAWPNENVAQFKQWMEDGMAP